MRKPTDADLRTALSVGHFGADAGPLPPGDPLQPTPMVASIQQIDTYERNPRRTANNKYEELKDSIRLNGLRQPLVITRRPGAPRYIPKHGGNTRLLILRELAAETGDPRFATANCLFEPWTTEADVLVGHLVENEMRGDLVFIDKARAILETKTLIEQEAGSKLSMRQLAEELRSRGYRVPLSNLPYCEYAAETLGDIVPQALAAGLGRPGIQRLRELDGAGEAVWEHRGLGPETLYRSIFAEAVGSVDNEAWDFDRARRALCDALAARAGSESRHILLEIGAELAGAVEEIGESESIPGIQDPVFDPADPVDLDPGARSDFVLDADSARSVSPARNQMPPARSTSSVPASAPSPHGAPERRSAPSESASGAEPSRSAAPVRRTNIADSAPQHRPIQAPGELERLRDTLRNCALDYATHAELAYCLRFEGSPWIRLGYIVADFPAPAQMAQLRNNFTARESLAWKWYELTRCCDLLPIAGHIERLYGEDAAAKERVFAELFGSNPRYLKAWISPDAFLEALSESVGVMDFQQFSFYAESVDEETWQSGVRLVQAYRDLKIYAATARIDLMQDQNAVNVPPDDAA